MPRRAGTGVTLLFALNLLFLSAIWLNERGEENLRLKVDGIEESHRALELELARETARYYSRLQAVRQEAALATSRAHDVEVELEVLQKLLEEVRRE